VKGVDRERNRLGKGGGFYDRFLGQKFSQKFSTLAVVPEFCVLDEVPVNAWDVRVDEVLFIEYENS
jgi:5-formyltetrahydrofolate cyclo-ligase